MRKSNTGAAVKQFLASAPNQHADGSWKAAILTLADEPDLAAELARLGYEVRPADSLALLLKTATHNPPDAILIDTDGSEIDVLDAVERLKTGDDTWFVPIVLLAGVVDADARARFFQAGADEVHPKPIAVAELVPRIISLLRLRKLYQTLLDENREIQAAYETQREAASTFQAFFAASPVAYCVLAPDTLQVTHVNEQAAMLTGYSSDSLVDRHIDSLAPDASDKGKWLSVMCGTLAASGALTTRDGAILSSSGERIPVEAVARRVMLRNRMVIEVALVDSRHQLSVLEDRVKAARLAMLRETAIAVNSKVNDPLFVILNDLITMQSSTHLDPSIQSRLSRALEAAQRIQRVTAQLSAVSEPVTREYLPGVRMLDLDESVDSASEWPQEAEQ